MSNKNNDIMLDDLNRYRFSTEPKKVRGQWNNATWYWKRYLARLIFGAFDFNNIPDGWDKNYMLTHLFFDGFFAICDTTMGVLPLKCGFSGINVFEMPTTLNIVNPVLGSFSKTIDVDCAFIRLQYTHIGISDMLNRYADLLAQCDKSIAVNLMNSNVACIMFADNEAQAKTMRRMYDTISKGEPVVYVKRSQVQKSDIHFNKVKENYIADEVQITQRKIIDQFLTTIGVNNANTDKRERMIRAEAESNDTEVQASVEHWLESVNAGLETANKLFNLNLEFVRKRFESETMDLLNADTEHGEMGGDEV